MDLKPSTTVGHSHASVILQKVVFTHPAVLKKDENEGLYTKNK